MIFGSDNQAGASQQIMDAVIECFSTHGKSYGIDDQCEAAELALKDVFETDLKAFFVATGTAANCLALSAMVQPWGHIACHHQAHILNDENTAPELFTGSARLKAVEPYAQKIVAADLDKWISQQPYGYPHSTEAQVLSVSQASETGHVYSVSEIHEICAVTKRHGLKVHMDGARFSNAVARLGCSPADLTHKAGVDILCLGATKNGAIAAEVIILFDQSLAENFAYRIKRTGHLLSKGRFLGAQICAWLKDGHWLDLANQANTAARELADVLDELPGVQLLFSVQSNEIFAIVPIELADRMTTKGVRFLDWPLSSIAPDHIPEQGKKLVRFVTSFMTTKSEIVGIRNLQEGVAH